MCSIAGILKLDKSGVPLEILKNMHRNGKHRGPDDEGIALFSPDGCAIESRGIKIDKNIKNLKLGLSHHRLSILDLSERGHQPMFDASGRFCIVHNGEIFNYIELRNELAGMGYSFRSQSDAEVILAAYDYWGSDCLKKFNGMWAFAIYDCLEKCLFCSRDRFGIKPFYYSFNKNYFVFGSEIKQVMAYMHRYSEVDSDIVADFLFWQYEALTEKTFLKNIFILKPSHYIIVDFKNFRSIDVKIEKYWDFEPQPQYDMEKATQIFRDLFFNAVRIRLRSDVPIGVTLSGGLDSSSVACTMAELMKSNNFQNKPKTYSSVYPDKGYSEEHFINTVVEKTNFNPVFIHPHSSDLKKEWERFVWHMEEPFAGLSYFSNWLVYKNIRKHNTPVILNGQGGDELLLGYERYRTAYILILLKQRKISKAIKEMFRIKKHGNISLYKQLLYFLYFAIPTVRIYRRRTLVKPYIQDEFYQKYKKHTDFVKAEFRNRSLHDFQSQEFFSYQLQHLLHHEDRVSMAFGIETRLPFLDYHLFNFVMSQDDEMLLSQGWSKYILREALGSYLPEAVKNRVDKMGYETPTKRLFEESKDYFSQLLNRHLNDEIINVPKLKTDYLAGNAEEHLLCSMFSFLQLRELFKI